MRNLCVLFALFLATVCASAQSLKPDNPYPLQAGVNQATSDSLIGTQYWYFYATPGAHTLTVRFKTPTTLYGTELNNNVLTITATDEKKTWKVVKTVRSSKDASEAKFTADKIDKKMKILVSVAPPNQNLLRMGGDYEIEATGDVQFDAVKSAADPIVRTYESKLNSYGAVKFLANGTLEAADGTTGTWKAFDSENRIYTVVIEGQKLSVKYRAGYGLVRPSEPNMIVFQEIK